VPSALTNPQDAEFWIFIALVLLAIVMWRAKVPSTAAKALDAAGDKVRAQLDEAQRLREEAETLLAKIRADRLEAERGAAELLKAAEEDAERLRVSAAAKLEDDIKRRARMAEQKIALAEAQAAQDVKTAAADLAALTAEAILAARVTVAKSDPLIDQGLKDLGSRLS
jgi:F-type H+-transporting ATPase subunit b